MLVKTIKRGNCIIEVYDDYAAKTPEEEKKVLDNIARVSRDMYLSQLYEKEAKKNHVK